MACDELKTSGEAKDAVLSCVQGYIFSEISVCIELTQRCLDCNARFGVRYAHSCRCPVVQRASTDLDHILSVGVVDGMIQLKLKRH